VIETRITRLRCALPAAAVLLACLSALFAGVGGTPHDFRQSSWSQGKMCAPCHTTHRGTDAGYSWNHAYPPDAAFTTRPNAALGRESLMCLGCHDGQTALDSFGGATGSTVMTGKAVVGRDLSNDHPVGATYPTSDSRYKSPASVMQDLPLFDGKVECGSCHDPHTNKRAKFLRMDTRSLCQTCHDL